MEREKSLFGDAAPSEVELRGGEGERAAAETRPAADIILEAGPEAAESATGTVGQEAQPTDQGRAEELAQLQREREALEGEIGDLRRQVEEEGLATGPRGQREPKRKVRTKASRNSPTRNTRPWLMKTRLRP